MLHLNSSRSTILYGSKGPKGQQHKSWESTFGAAHEHATQRHQILSLSKVLFMQDRLTEQEPSTSDPMRPRTSSSSRASSGPLHDHIGTADHCTVRARSEATMSHPARPRSQPLYHLPTDRSAVDGHELVRSALNFDIFNEEDRQRQEEEQEDEDYNDNEGGR